MYVFFDKYTLYSFVALYVRYLIDWIIILITNHCKLINTMYTCINDQIDVSCFKYCRILHHLFGIVCLLLTNILHYLIRDLFLYNHSTQHRSSASIILRGANDFFVDEMERSIHDSLCVIKRIMESNEVVAGGGAVETALSIYLENLATSIVSTGTPVDSMPSCV